MKPIYIIFEGPEKTGKTKQSKLLRSYLLKIGMIPHILSYSDIILDTVTNTRFKTEVVYNELFKIFNLINKSSYDNCMILNGSHIGESVYSPLYKNYDGDYVFNIEENYSKMGFWDRVFLFVFLDKPENLIDRTKFLDDESFKKERKRLLKELSLFKRANIFSKIENKKLIYPNRLTDEEIHKQIIDFIEMKKEVF